MLRFKRIMPKQQATTTIYEFKDTTAPPTSGEVRKARGRSEDDGTAGSLSYSAASSTSMASTESSFAEFRRVLEGDSKELATFLKEHAKRDEKSVAADSLAYSTDADTMHGRSYGTDAESQLQGSSLVSGGTSSHRSERSSSNHSNSQHYASPFSASYLNNGGGQRPDLNDNFFTATNETLQRRKERKRRDRVVPQPVDVDGKQPPKESSSAAASSKVLASSSNKQRLAQNSTRKTIVKEDEDDEVWYTKWWTLCFLFPDVMTSKR